MEHGVILAPDVEVRREGGIEGHIIFHKIISNTLAVYERHDGLSKLIEACSSRPLSVESAAYIIGGGDPDIASIEALIADGLLIDSSVVNSGRISGGRTRYSERVDMIVPYCGAGVSAQEVADSIRRLTVDIVGLGGVGSWLVMYLSMLGVGRLRLWDDDVVEDVNLARQPLYSVADVGHPKAESAQSYVRRHFLGDTVVETFVQSVTQDAPIDIFEGADIVFGCGSDPSTSIFCTVIAERCAYLGVSYIVGGGYHGHANRFGISVADVTDACGKCLAFAPAHGGSKWLLESRPWIEPRILSNALPSSASQIGGLYIREMLGMLIPSQGRLMRNRVGEFDWTTFEASWWPISINPDCDLHDPSECDYRLGTVVGDKNVLS